MGKVKDKKKAAAAKKKVIPAADKAKMKSELKAVQVVRDAAIAEKDTKKLKAARYKIKKMKAALRKVVAAPPIVAEKKEESAA
ncbi:MAG: hypothetical protein HZA22_12940 [Nitrospirae bacterium]|nr:hypothetical protein [Nitrospirota bacterium]MBI5696688.1 hypothetical protein [Nitrospirota bacterium]